MKLKKYIVNNQPINDLVDVANLALGISRYTFDRLAAGQQAAQMLLSMVNEKSQIASHCVGPDLILGQTFSAKKSAEEVGGKSSPKKLAEKFDPMSTSGRLAFALA